MKSEQIQGLKKLVKDDIIECEVNRKNGTLSYKIGEGSQIEVFRDQKICIGDLYFAVSLYEQGQEIEIVP